MIVSEMKFIFGIALFFWMLNSVSCSKRPIPMKQPSDASDGLSQSLQRLDDQFHAARRANDREYFYSVSPSIEQLLGVPDDVPKRRWSTVPILTNAFVITFTSSNSIIVRENILGRIPVDYATLLPNGSPPGEYLIGLLMPQGGWTIGRTRGRASFCVPLKPDDTFSYGFEGELTERLATIRKFKTTDR